MKTWIRAATGAALGIAAAPTQGQTGPQAKALLDAAQTKLKKKGVGGAVKGLNFRGEGKWVKSYPMPPSTIT